MVVMRMRTHIAIRMATTEGTAIRTSDITADIGAVGAAGMAMDAAMVTATDAGMVTDAATDMEAAAVMWVRAATPATEAGVDMQVMAADAQVDSHAAAGVVADSHAAVDSAADTVAAVDMAAAIGNS